MEKKKVSGKLILILIVAAIVLVVGIMKISEANRHNRITEEYGKIVDSKIEEYLSADETVREYGTELGLTEIQYEITKIFEEDDTDILSLEIRLTCEDDSWETTNSLLAYEVEEECFRLEEKTLDSYFYVDKYRCSYMSKRDKQYFFQDLITVYVNDVVIHSPEARDTSNTKDTVKCEVCEKRYNKGSDNAKSISHTNMCSNCYSNFKWTQDAMDAINNLPVD